MKAVYCVAVDLGASNGRVIVGTWRQDRLELDEVRRFPNQFRVLGGYHYWEVATLWAEVCAGLREAKRRFPALASVGVDSWGVDHVLVDSGGRLVFPIHAYRDERTRPGMRRLAARGLGRMYAATGIPNIFYNTSLQLEETVCSFPAIRRIAARCLFLPDYFNYLLSGRMENELSIASTSQLLGVEGLGFSRVALRRFGLPATWFSRPIKASTRLGWVRSPPGLQAVRVVAVPGHDTACAFDSLPALPAGGDLLISSGTWSLVGFESETPLLGAAALAAKVSNERLGNGRFRPLTNVAGLWLLQQVVLDFGRKPSSAAAWAALIRTAERAPRTSLLLDVDDPAFSNPLSMRAAIAAQLRLRRGRPPVGLAGYLRLICDSLGQGHAAVLRRFERLSGHTFRRILITGGGAKNRLLCQATADSAGLPVFACSQEGAATGNLVSQLIALRVIKNLSVFRELLTRQGAFTVYYPRRSAAPE